MFSCRAVTLQAIKDTMFPFPHEFLGELIGKKRFDFKVDVF